MYESLFNRYYSDQALYGYGISPTFYRSPIFQSGSAVNHGTFSSILKSALKFAKPAAKFLAKKGIRATADTANKMLDGKSLKQSLSEVGGETYNRTKRNISKSIRQQLNNSSKSRKRPRLMRRKKQKIKRKRYI